MSTDCGYEIGNSLINKKNIFGNNSILSLNSPLKKANENKRFNIYNNNDINQKESLSMTFKNKNNEEKSIKNCKTTVNPEIFVHNFNDSNYKGFFKKDNFSYNKENIFKSTKDTLYPYKKEKKEVEYIPINNDLSMVFNNSILHKSNIKEININNNNINNNKDKKESNLSKFFKERNKKFLKEHKRIRNSMIFTNILYQINNTTVRCALLLKEKELFILNNINTIDGSLSLLNYYPPNSETNLAINDINNEQKDTIQSEGNNVITENNKLISIQKLYNLSKPLFYINFELMSCKALINKNTNWIKILVFGYNENSLNIFIENKENYSEFIYLLNEQIHKTQKEEIDLLEFTIKENPIYYNHSIISLEEFTSISKTGDLLLFKSKHCGSRFQRFLSGDTYDHVAIIEKKNGVLSLYQSTLNGNIDFAFWNLFLTYSSEENFDKIVYRRLHIEAENKKELKNIQKEIEEKFEQFVKETNDKNYYLSFKNLIFCDGIDQDQINGEWSKMKGFSCSALAAAFYIKIGAIKQERNIHSARPGDFQDNKNILKFNQKFSLGPERVLFFPY